MGKIKGWKKVREGKNQIHYINDSQVYRGIKPTNVLIDKHPTLGWRVFVNDLVILSRNREFLENISKERAMREAISYMRSHPNG